MSRKRKFDEAATKYRCCFGTMHVQTVTKIVCSLFLLICIINAKDLIADEEYDGWEAVMIIFGSLAAVGPLFGIKKKKARYFFPYFAAYPIRMFIYFALLLSLCIIDSQTTFGQEINDILLSSYDLDGFGMLFEIFPILLIIKIGIVLLFILEIWAVYCIYKCYKYISELPHSEYRQPLRNRTDKKINGNLVTSNSTKQSITSLSILRRIGFTAAIEFLYAKYAKKAEVLKTKAAEVEHLAKSKPKTQEGLIQQLKIKTKSKPEECSLEMHLNNHIMHSESVNFVIAEAKSTKILEKVVKQPQVEQRPSNTMTSLESCFYYSKPKNLVSCEIQTDDTSFNQTVANSQRQKIYSSSKDFDYDFDSYSVSPKPFTSCARNECNCDQNSMVTASSGFCSISDADNFSPYQTSSPNTEESATVVTVLFKNDETCAIEVYQNGRKKRLENQFDNEWTPLYFSMAAPKPEVGEKALKHYHEFRYREYVLYDIFKVVGKSINEIEVDPEWKFKIVENKGIKCFQIKTQKGLCLFPEDSIVAAFLKSMKVRAENYLNIKVNEIYLSSNFDLTESQKNVFKNAASKLYLEILNFYVIDDL